MLDKDSLVYVALSVGLPFLDYRLQHLFVLLNISLGMFITLLWRGYFLDSKRTQIWISSTSCQAVYIPLLWYIGGWMPSTRSDSVFPTSSLRIIDTKQLLEFIKSIPVIRDFLLCARFLHMKKVCFASSMTPGQHKQFRGHVLQPWLQHIRQEVQAALTNIFLQLLKSCSSWLAETKNFSDILW